MLDWIAAVAPTAFVLYGCACLASWIVGMFPWSDDISL